eukprot:scaffold54498_cov31-Tisochrysis_lutea.AAC.2
MRESSPLSLSPAGAERDNRSVTLPVTLASQGHRRSAPVSRMPPVNLASQGHPRCRWRWSARTCSRSFRCPLEQSNSPRTQCGRNWPTSRSVNWSTREYSVTEQPVCAITSSRTDPWQAASQLVTRVTKLERTADMISSKLGRSNTVRSAADGS